MALDVGVGLALLAALIAVIALFARLFGPGIARSAQRVATGKADGSDILPAIIAATALSAGDGGASCDGGGGGCD